jgi:putative membrane protein
MRKRNWLSVTAVGVCAGAMLVTIALAQQTPTNDSNANRGGQPRAAAPRAASRGTQQYDGAAAAGGRYTAQRPTADYGQHAYTDQQLAAWLLVDNRGEIALAQLAQEKASSSDVRDLAQHLIDDHSKMVEKLERFAGGRRRTRGGDNRATNNRRSQGAAYDEFAAGGQPQSSAGLNFVRIKQQLGQQCLASSKQELEQKDGNEFDECFLGLQIAKHMEMIDTLKVFSHYASENLDQVIEEAEDSAQEHLDRAKDLIKDVTSGGHHKSTAGTKDRDTATERSAARSRSSDSEKRD